MNVTLLERQTDFGREFRGEMLMPSGIAALERAGLGEQVKRLPQTAIAAVEIFRGTKKIAQIPFFSLPVAPTVVPQPPMLEMITAEAAKFPNFKLERGTTVRDLISESGRVVGVRADTVHGPREFRADFLVATDGRTSVVRKRLGAAVDRIEQRFDVVWTHVPGEFLDSRTAQFVFCRGHLFIIYPSPEGHLQIGWIIQKGHFGELRSLGGEGWFAAMTPFLPRDLIEFLSPNREAMAHPVLLDVVCDRLRDWMAPGVLLIGDAAHPMSPVGAQGINIAMRDAIVTAAHLGRAMSDNAPAEKIDTAARAVESERAPEVVRIQELQQLGPRLMFTDTLYSRAMMSAPFVWFAKNFLSGILIRRLSPMLNGATDLNPEA